jgi:hypothetical protein
MIQIIQGDDYADDLSITQYPDLTGWSCIWAVVSELGESGLTFVSGSALISTDKKFFEIRIEPLSCAQIPVGKWYLVAEASNANLGMSREILQAPIQIKPQGIPLPDFNYGGASKAWGQCVTVTTTPYNTDTTNAIFLCDTNAQPISFIFPLASVHPLRTIYIENTGSEGNNLTLVAQGSDTIMDYAEIDLTDQQGKSFYSNGSVWRDFKG